MTTSNRLQTLRLAVREFGPLRWVVLASAVLPTTGLLVLLAQLDAVASALPAGPVGAFVAAAVVAAATGALLLPPSFAAFAAGYLFGPLLGALVAAPAIAIGGVFGAAVVWPCVAPTLYPFMNGRPRLEAVRSFCAVPLPASIGRVALVRGAARVPFSVVNLLLSGACVDRLAIGLGTLVAMVPLATTAAGLGAAFAAWRVRGELPSVGALGLVAAAAAALLAFALVARRRFKPPA